MRINIHGRNVDVTPKLQAYVERKVERLDRYMPHIAEIRVDLNEEKASSRMENGHSAQITLRHERGTILRAEERNSDIYAAVDIVTDKMYRQIERWKGRRKRRNDPQIVFDEYETAVDLPEEEFESGAIVRRKEFEVYPMNELEAIEQMELLGHDFYVYMDANSGNICVMYRRRDGNYGLLQPMLP